MRRFNFFSEIKKEAMLGDLIPSSQFVVIDFSCVYFEGVENVLSLNEEEIDIKTKKTNIRITGSNLEIKEMSDKTVIIRGLILGVNQI